MRRAVIVAALFAAACSAAERSIPVCEVGEQAECSCVDGTEGLQTCAATQTFQPCVCGGAAAASGSADGTCSPVADNMIRLATAELDRDSYMTPEKRKLSIHVIKRAAALLAQTCERQQWSDEARACAEAATTRTVLTDCEDMAYRTRGSGTPSCSEVATHIRGAAEHDPSLPADGPARDAELARIERDVRASCERQRWDAEERRCMGNVKTEVDYRLCEELIAKRR